ncbi:MAG: ribose 5-phosphate isomerase B [Fimbriimonadaceae bacterium]|nr:ribose 5-phosphate isomerase B [Fimbriimonadaceae bacterium]
MRVAIGADHAGYELKNQLVIELENLGHSVQDLGAHAYDALDDYPDFAARVADAVAKGNSERGIVVCGSGVGACIASNKVVGVRAGIATDTYSARQGVEHDDMNVLAIGARITGIEVVREILRAFLDARFSGEARHVRRLQKVLDIERRAANHPAPSAGNDASNVS